MYLSPPQPMMSSHPQTHIDTILPTNPNDQQAQQQQERQLTTCTQQQEQQPDNSHDISNNIAIPPSILDSCLTLPPAQDHQYTIIFFHGVAEHPEKYVDMFKALELVHTKIVLPRAPKKSITAFRGKVVPAWYNIQQFKGKRGFGESEDYLGMNETMAQMELLYNHELALLPSPSHLLTGGFSQGATITQTFAPRYPHVLPPTLAFSGYTLLTLAPVDEVKYPIVNKEATLVIVHGDKDPVVTPEFSHASRHFWRTHGVAVIEYDEPDGIHSISSHGLTILRKYIDLAGLKWYWFNSIGVFIVALSGSKTAVFF